MLRHHTEVPPARAVVSGGCSVLRRTRAYQLVLRLSAAAWMAAEGGLVSRDDDAPHLASLAMVAHLQVGIRTDGQDLNSGERRH